jgi:dihydrodipicolinate synthase/N-acetylneuraminate lyase
VTELSRIFFAGESVVGSLKAALSILGLCSPITSIPIPSASKESMRKIRQIMADCGLI